MNDKLLLISVFREYLLTGILLIEGLFHKVILQSGYALSQLWAIRNDTLERAFEYGHILGFQGNNPKRLLRYLKNKSAMDLALMGAPLRTCLKQVGTYPILRRQ